MDCIGYTTVTEPRPLQIKLNFLFPITVEITCGLFAIGKRTKQQSGVNACVQMNYEKMDSFKLHAGRNKGDEKITN